MMTVSSSGPLRADAGDDTRIERSAGTTKTGSWGDWRQMHHAADEACGNDGRSRLVHGTRARGTLARGTLARIREAGRVGGVAAVLLSVVAFAGHAAGDSAVANLARAGHCKSHSSRWYAGQNIAVKMRTSNDGWCWRDTWAEQHHLYVTARDVTLLSPPHHGRVLIGDVAQRQVRVAYRPDPGFVGTDDFRLHYGIMDTVATYSVQVGN